MKEIYVNMGRKKMKCPFCNNYFTTVIDSRETKDGTEVRRRRKCLECDKRFITIEKFEGEAGKREKD